MGRSQGGSRASGGRRKARLADRLALFTAWLLSCALVYLLGLYVGKSLQERRLGEEERVIRLPVTPGSPGPAAGRGASGDELSFYRTLGKGAASGPQAPEARAPAGTVVSPPGRPRAPVSGARVAPRGVAAAAASQHPRGQAVPPSQGGVWSVQVDATRRPEEARARIRDLRARGYDAYLVRVNIRGETWYRVRVGRYGTLERANEMVLHLKEREGLRRAFVCSE